MKRLNCWEFKDCGKEPGGFRVYEQGVCPAAKEEKYHRINKGKNGGRFCWAVSGTFCKGEPKGSYAQKLFDCINCDFMKNVIFQENIEFILSPKDAESRKKK